MKIWVDDLREAPYGYVWMKSVREAIECIEFAERELSQIADPALKEYSSYSIKVIDIDHDAGDYARFGGDYIKLLNWLEETGRNYPIRLHSMNPVGVQNMRAIIQRNGWQEIR